MKSMIETTGQVQKIKYSGKGGYVAFSAMVEDKHPAGFKQMGIWPCVGFYEGLEEDDYITMGGDFQENAKYGRQFKAEYIFRTIPHSIEQYEKYLIKYVPGVGESTAKKILEEFGGETFNVIQNDFHKLTVISGISEKKAEKIHKVVIENSMTRDEHMMFLKLDIGMSYGAKIKEFYKDDTKKILYTNPYKLVQDIKGIGFLKADKIAMKAGIKKDSRFRIESGILYSLENASVMGGHTYLPITELVKLCVKILELPENLITPVIEEMVKNNLLIKEEGSMDIYLPVFYYTEQKVANKLTSLLSKSSNQKKDVVLKKIKDIEQWLRIELDPTQREAVYTAIDKDVTIITGGPGTGKTTTLNVLIHYLEQNFLDKILLLAPTGRAAKRMSEQTKRLAYTVHRQILPLEEDDVLDAQVIIVDEMSMVDLHLMSALLSHIKDGTKLILVGDKDQLPSVGPGAVLRDMLASGKIPTAYLTHIHRQAEDSNIIKNAHRINNGQKTEFNSDFDDFVFVPEKEGEHALQSLLTLYTRNLPHHFHIEPTDIQILAPMKNGILGITNLNNVIQQTINPASEDKNQVQLQNTIFREGDKVMHVKNNYALEWVDTSSGIKGKGVFNGDVGFIRSINTKDDEYVIDFEDGRRAWYDSEDLKDLILAYAITIHKSQGSEYPVIIIPLLNGGPPILYNRNLLYTAVTRAKQSVIIMGQKKVLHTMESNSKKQVRYTGLEEKIRNTKK